MNVLSAFAHSTSLSSHLCIRMHGPTHLRTCLNQPDVSCVASLFCSWLVPSPFLLIFFALFLLVTGFFQASAQMPLRAYIAM
jgi:hypothetical protein